MLRTRSPTYYAQWNAQGSSSSSWRWNRTTSSALPGPTHHQVASLVGACLLSSTGLSVPRPHRRGAFALRDKCSMCSPLCVVQHTKPQRKFGSDHKGLRLGRLICVNCTYHRQRHSCRIVSHPSYVQARGFQATPTLLDLSGTCSAIRALGGPLALLNRVVICRFAISSKNGIFFIYHHPPIAGSGRHESGITCATISILYGHVLMCPRLFGPGLFGNACANAPLPRQGSTKLLGHETPPAGILPTCPRRETRLADLLTTL